MGERVLALQPGVPHPIARVLEAGLRREPGTAFAPLPPPGGSIGCWVCSRRIGPTDLSRSRDRRDSRRRTRGRTAAKSAWCGSTADGCEVWAGPRRRHSISRWRPSPWPAAGEGPHPHVARRRQLRPRSTPHSDVFGEAASIARATGERRPIKVMWTREDDIQGGFYRPLYVHRLRAGLDAAGRILAWEHRIVGQSIVTGTPLASLRVENGIDKTSSKARPTCPMPFRTSGWSCTRQRSACPYMVALVGSTHTAYSTETFLDVAARAAARDPLDVRRSLLRGHPRHLGVLELAAREAGWGSPCHRAALGASPCTSPSAAWWPRWPRCRLTAMALPKAERVVCAVDCGIAVNPDIVRAQVEGSIGYGLSAALWGEITLAGGRVLQSNFHDYRVLRIEEMPQVEVHIVPSVAPPRHGGAGPATYCASRGKRAARAHRPPSPPLAFRPTGRGRKRMRGGPRQATAAGVDTVRRGPRRHAHRLPDGRSRRVGAGSCSGRDRAAAAGGLRLSSATGRRGPSRTSSNPARSSSTCAVATATRTAIGPDKATTAGLTSRRCGAAPTATASPGFAARAAISPRTTTRQACPGNPAGSWRRGRWRCRGLAVTALHPAQGPEPQRGPRDRRTRRARRQRPAGDLGLGAGPGATPAPGTPATFAALVQAWADTGAECPPSDPLGDIPEGRLPRPGRQGAILFVFMPLAS